MPAPTRPTNYKKPFADTGTRNVIPDAPTGTNKASFSEGFPPVTMIPVTSGGVPPSGDDFNGILYDATQHVVWINAGGQYQFDAALSTAMGGYPLGMVLQSNDGLSSYVSLVAANTTDFNSTPSSIGSLWGSYAGASFSNAAIASTGGSTTLTAIQSIADMITVTGILTSNATLVFPNAAKDFLIVNATTGAFSLTCKTAAGTGVSIKQGSGDAIYCDATNVLYQQASSVDRAVKDASKSIANTGYADRAASDVGGYAIDTGVANAYVIATVPVTTTYRNGQTARLMPAHANTSISVTLDAGGGAKQVIRGDGSQPRVNDITATMILNVTYIQFIDKWIINGLIVPDAALVRKQYANATQTFYSGDWLIDTSAGPFAGNLNSTPLFGDAITFNDANGAWANSPFTLLATGGYSITTTTFNGTVWTDTTFIDNVRGHVFTVWFNGTAWELI